MASESAPARSRRTLHAAGAAVATWVVLSLPVGGLSRLLYYSLGEPSWFPWLGLVVLPAMLALCLSNAVDAYRDAPANWFSPQRWARQDTIGLLVLVLFAAAFVGTWAVSGNLPVAAAVTFVIIGCTVVTALVVTGIRMTRQRTQERVGGDL